MRKSEITSFFKIYNQIQAVINQLDMRSPFQYNVRLKDLKEYEEDQITILLDIYDDYNTEDGFVFNIRIPLKYLDVKYKNDLQDLVDGWIKLIHTNIQKIKNLKTYETVQINQKFS